MADPSLRAVAALVTRARGPTAAWTVVRKFGTRTEDLQRHLTWFASARAYLKNIEDNLNPPRGILWLDYGGVIDIVNIKVTIYSKTVLTVKGREQEHFDFFFGEASQAHTRPRAKKNGKTGKYFLGELFDPKKDPEGVDGCLFSARYPQVTKIILLGDTGNGYHTYDMLEELSHFHTKYGYKVKLIPLPPGHAHDRGKPDSPT